MDLIALQLSVYRLILVIVCIVALSNIWRQSIDPSWGNRLAATVPLLGITIVELIVVYGYTGALPQQVTVALVPMIALVILFLTAQLWRERTLGQLHRDEVAARIL